MLVVSSFLTYFSTLSEIFYGSLLTHCCLASLAALWALLW